VGAAAGIHLLLRLHSVTREQLPQLLEACRAKGVGVYASDPYYSRPDNTPELILGYASMNEADIVAGIRRLANAIFELQGEDQ
jgi:GntR family transcriptional regulator / MocR family aminotransferase